VKKKEVNFIFSRSFVGIFEKCLNNSKNKTTMSHSNNSTTGANPFLAPYDTPFGAIPYDRITLEDYIPAIKEAIRN
jgi:hypothetical protein